MPTASQCQILNALVRTEVERSTTPYLVDDPEPEAEAEADFASNPVSPYPTPIHLGTSSRGSPVTVRRVAYLPERPNTSIGIRERRNYHYGRQREPPPVPLGGTDTQTFSPYQMDQPPSGSYWGRRRPVFGSRVRSANALLARFVERQHEVTSFQQQCMDMVEHAIERSDRQGMTPRIQEESDCVVDHSLNRRPLTNIPRATAIHVPCEISQPRPRHSMSAGVKPIREESQIPESPPTRPKTAVLEEIRTFSSPPTRQLVRFNSSVKVFDSISSQLVNEQIKSNIAAAATLAAVESEMEDAGADLKEEEEIGSTPQSLFPAGQGPTLMLPIVLTDQMRTRLWELGWRRPASTYKIKKEEDNIQRTNYDLSNLPLMDLKKDPMLRKARKTRIVPIQTKPPEPNPTAVCFNFLGSSLTHRDVWLAFKRDILAQHPEVRIRSIQYVPRAIFIRRPKGGDPIDDRWIITFTSEWFRNRVAGMEMKFRGVDPVQLRRYDDIANCEYRQYTRMNDYMKMVSLKK